MKNYDNDKVKPVDEIITNYYDLPDVKDYIKEMTRPMVNVFEQKAMDQLIQERKAMTSEQLKVLHERYGVRRFTNEDS